MNVLILTAIALAGADESALDAANHAAKDALSPPAAQTSEPVKVRFAPLEVPDNKRNPKAAMREARNMGHLEGREHPPLMLRPLPDGGFVIEHAKPETAEAPQ